ncbi:MAG: hypothetical protein HQ567_19740 [Candidatus Nealsonbacteria bacterium]|nr:hypothetical protein [Candidatus Nealsonbacteria bacterium]
MKIESLPRRCHRLTAVVLTTALLVVCSVVSLAFGADAKPAGSFEISAWTFDRGTAKVFPNPDLYADYRDKFPELVVGDGGQLPWTIEYDVNFPVDATYTLHVSYGSPEPRPMEVWLDGRRMGECCGRVTGNAPPYMDRHPQHNRPRDAENFHGIEWEEACKLPTTEGKHTLKFTCGGLPPRLSALRIESPVAFPEDWKLAPREVKLDHVQPNCRRIFLPPGSVNVAALKVAVEDMTAQFGPQYPAGPQHLKKLAELQRKQAAKDAAPEQQQKIEDALQSLQSEAMLAHPALKFDRLLFLKQKHRDVSIYTGHTADGDPGGNLCVLSPVAPNGPLSPDGNVTELVPELAGGIFGRFDLSFDATKIVFCYTKEGEQYRIYEIDIDPKTGLRVPGKSLRQITSLGKEEAETIRLYEGSISGRGYDDMDPCYLPNGKIMFSSTRAHRCVLCAPQTATTLHVMDGDGKNIRCISSGQVNELAPCLLNDGRVAYTRWEYVDKGFGNAQSLWAVHPDGSGSDHVYKNTLVRPGAMINVRSIPGSRQFVTIGVGHHGGLAGPVIMVDTRHNRRNSKGMTNITPEISYPGLYPMKGKAGSGWFREPHPFSEKFFLVSHNAPPHGEKKRFGIYVLDSWGNRAELYSDADISCFQPTPLRPRPRPTEISPVARRSEGKEEPAEMATLFLQDVYLGMTGIERGRIKYLRVMEAMTLSWSDGYRSGKQGDGGPGMQASAVSFAADPAIKKTYGIATVHADGSAHFAVPAEKNLFFQALDENYMEVQRMRTFINLMPGERRSCIGCHELRSKAPKLITANPAALDRPIQTLTPQPGDRGPRTVHYARDVQPIFDKHCISCHGGRQPKAELDLADELTEKFSRSYETLFEKQLVSFLQGGFGSANVPAEPPLTFGSHQSKLVERIRKAPCKANLSREEFIRIVTWIDANAPYYGTHEGKKNLKWKDEPDFRPLPLAGK